MNPLGPARWREPGPVVVRDWLTGRPIECPDVERVLSLFRRLDVSRFPLPLRVELWKADVHHGTVHVEFWIHVKARERDTGEPVMLKFTYGGSFSIDSDLPRQMLLWIQGGLRDAVLHELDECLLLDGKRIVDRHAKDAPTR